MSRNVVVRSFDASAHAHVMVAHRGVVQLDSVELRWLGPAHDCTRAEEPVRRAALYFHQQRDASDASFVRHAAIWGGKREFFHAETSNGIEVTDVVGYDGQAYGFVRDFDNSACGLRCMEPADDLGAIRRVQFTEVLAAKVAVANRHEDCAAIGAAIRRVGGRTRAGASALSLFIWKLGRVAWRVGRGLGNRAGTRALARRVAVQPGVARSPRGRAAFPAS